MKERKADRSIIGASRFHAVSLLIFGSILQTTAVGRQTVSVVFFGLAYLEDPGRPQHGLRRSAACSTLNPTFGEVRLRLICRCKRQRN